MYRQNHSVRKEKGETVHGMQTQQKHLLMHFHLTFSVSYIQIMIEKLGNVELKVRQRDTPENERNKLNWSISILSLAKQSNISEFLRIRYELSPFDVYQASIRTSVERCLFNTFVQLDPTKILVFSRTLVMQQYLMKPLCCVASKSDLDLVYIRRNLLEIVVESVRRKSYGL